MIGYYCFALLQCGIFLLAKNINKLTAAPGVPPKSYAWTFFSSVSPFAFDSCFLFPAPRCTTVVISKWIYLFKRCATCDRVYRIFLMLSSTPVCEWRVAASHPGFIKNSSLQLFLEWNCPRGCSLTKKKRLPFQQTKKHHGDGYLSFSCADFKLHICNYFYFWCVQNYVLCWVGKSQFNCLLRQPILPIKSRVLFPNCLLQVNIGKSQNKSRINTYPHVHCVLKRSPKICKTGGVVT